MRSISGKVVHRIDGTGQPASPSRSIAKLGRPRSHSVLRATQELTQQLCWTIRARAKDEDGRPLSNSEIEVELGMGPADARTGKNFGRHLGKRGRPETARALAIDALHCFFERAAEKGWLNEYDMPGRRGGLRSTLRAVLEAPADKLPSELLSELESQRKNVAKALQKAREALATLLDAAEAAKSCDVVDLSPVEDLDEDGQVTRPCGDPVQLRRMLSQLENAGIVTHDPRQVLLPRISGTNPAQSKRRVKASVVR